MAIPTLLTERLILRPPNKTDLVSFSAMLASDRARYMGGPYDAVGAWRVFCQDIALWQVYGHGALMIDLRATGECVGQVGINHGPLYPEKELGWLLYGDHEGNGYAQEAAAAMRDWAFVALKLPHLVSYVDADNASSIAVAQRIGGVLDPDAPKQDPEDFVFRYISPIGRHQR
jgi:RimJ/RimL family protein N-acetyltransferase